MNQRKGRAMPQDEGELLIKPSSTDHPLYEPLVEACKTVYDPEIPVNIFDLGLIYTITISDAGEVDVIMTLTAPGTLPGGWWKCPAGSRAPWNGRCPACRRSTWK